MTLADFEYPVWFTLVYIVLATKDFQIIWLSNLMTLSVPDEGYSRNLQIIIWYKMYTENKDINK